MSEVTSTALATREPNPIGPMLQAIMEKGITAESVAALEKMTDLYERMERRNSEREAAAAFVELQRQVAEVNVQATKFIPDNSGNVRSTFAPYKEIMDKVGPCLLRSGFSVKYDHEFTDGRCTCTCILQHAGAYEYRNKYTVRVGGGPPKASDMQADSAAGSFAQRKALCAALNIVVDHEYDARAEGDYISPEAAADLEARIRKLGGDPAAYLKLADAATFADIREAKHGVLLAAIAKRERESIPQFPDVAAWRSEMLEVLAVRGAKSPPAAFDAIVKSRGFDSYLSVPPDKRQGAWVALKAGKLDQFI